MISVPSIATTTESNSVPRGELMQYFVKRGDEKFGPYTLAELQRYVQAGNISPEDLTQSEGMTDLAPVSQVLGNIPSTTPSVDKPPAPTFQHLPPPPTLHLG